MSYDQDMKGHILHLHIGKRQLILCGSFHDDCEGSFVRSRRIC